MADSKISGLTDGAPAQSTDVVPISRTTDVATRRLTLANLSTLFATTLASIFAPALHAAQHAYGAADEVPFAITVNKNGIGVGSRRILNFIEGSSITLTITDNGTDINVTIASSGGSYTDEQAQDAVGGTLTDTATIDLTYNDGAATITADVKSASITEAMQVLADNTTQDVSITKHGYAPKAPNDATKYLDGTGSYTVPVGSGGYTDEQAQDAVGTILTDTATIDFVYTDAAPTIEASVKSASITEAMQVLADNTTQDVSSTKHGYVPKSPADSTKFLDGSATPVFDTVKDSDLSTSDITTNDASTSKHGFLKKLDNTAAHYMDGTGAWSTPAGGSGATYLYVASDFAITSAGFVDITGLTFSVDANGIYAIDGYIIYQTSTTGMGVLFSVNGPASPTTVEFFNQKQFATPATTSTDSIQFANIIAYDTANPVSTAEPVQNLNENEVVYGVFVNGSNAGTFAFRLSKENVAGTATVKAGSWIRYKKLN